MIDDVPRSSKEKSGRLYDDEQAQGLLIQYGNGPVSTNIYETPAPKAERERKKHRDRDGKKDEKKDKKRKRPHLDTVKDGDELMTDAPPTVLHSGLTGGLNRLLSRPSVFPPSPDYSGGDPGENQQISPVKRSKHSKRERESRAEGFGNTIMSLITARKTSEHGTDEDGRPRKHRHRRQRDDTERAHDRMIEYKPVSGDEGKQVAIRHDRAEQFMSFVTKGPESEHGASMRKTLKRYLRERSAHGHTSIKEEEKELWRALRVKKNDRGEVVLFF